MRLARVVDCLFRQQAPDGNPSGEIYREGWVIAKWKQKYQNLGSKILRGLRHELNKEAARRKRSSSETLRVFGIETADFAVRLMADGFQICFAIHECTGYSFSSSPKNPTTPMEFLDEICFFCCSLHLEAASFQIQCQVTCTISPFWGDMFPNVLRRLILLRSKFCSVNIQAPIVVALCIIKRRNKLLTVKWRSLIGLAKISANGIRVGGQ